MYFEPFAIQFSEAMLDMTLAIGNSRTMSGIGAGGSGRRRVERGSEDDRDGPAGIRAAVRIQR